MREAPQGTPFDVTTLRRCFVCAADMLEPSGRSLTFSDGRRRAFELACGSCGVLLDGQADAARCRAHLTEALAGPTFVSDGLASYGLDLFTLRIAATRLGRGIRPLDAEGRAGLLHPHAAQAARAVLYDLDGAETQPVSLGLLCRPFELDEVLAGLPDWTDDVAIVLDAETAPPRAVAVPGFAEGTVRVAARPLAGDFAAQRNALQRLARHRWMLQLDADESFDPAAGRRLPALAAMAEADAVRSIGLARENRIDGVLADVFPDVQYRLNRRDVTYAGRVHERPWLAGGWRESFITLHGAIEHRLSRAHVEARSRRYEAIAPGRGRPEEAQALLRPYRD
ncbi:glycosyltransferase family protein [Methylorubrum aminovorans]